MDKSSRFGNNSKAKIQRPKFTVVVGVLLFALCQPVEAQQPTKSRRIGILSAAGGPTEAIEIFRQSLHELGWIEGKNIAYEYRFAGGKEGRLPALAAELLRMNIEIFVATTPRGGHAAQQLTSTIPVIITAINDPVDAGFVNSLGQPGGNVTGVSYMPRELGGKRLELLKEIIPGLSRVAVLSNVGRGQLAQERPLREIEAVSRSLSMNLHILEIKKADEIDNAFLSMVARRAGAFIVLTQSIFLRNRKKIVELAANNRLPAIYHRSEYVEAGGLMSYGPDHSDLYRRAAFFVDKILKGAKPEHLPVEQPTKVELVINLKTARHIGLTIPTDVLMWADRVIR